jgi:hypothetical protein
VEDCRFSLPHPKSQTSYPEPNGKLGKFFNEMRYLKEVIQANQSINQSINQAINQSINQSSNQSIKQSINQAINQSINQSIKALLL